jgi:hypothetical protein
MAKNQIKLGIIGMSEANGHPYSWSAICNGYNKDLMSECPFSVIPKYLSEKKWPESKIQNVKITHIWTQDKKISKNIAASTYIENIVENYQDMINQVDGVLLARDDAIKHYEFSLPFLNAGIPIYIDKPLSVSVADAKKILDSQQYDSQIFTCSALRYAKEFYLNKNDRKKTGNIFFIEANIPNSWEKYAVHLIEPIIAGNYQRGELKNISVKKIKNIHKVFVKWNELEAQVSTYENYNFVPEIIYYGELGYVKKLFVNTFDAFKKAIESYLLSIVSKKIIIPRNETLEIISIIEKGRNE